MQSLTLRILVVSAILVLAAPAPAQVFVYPRRPNKSQVRYFDFDWRHVDILVGPEADTREADEPKVAPGETGGVPPQTLAPAAPDALEAQLLGAAEPTGDPSNPWRPQGSGTAGASEPPAEGESEAPEGQTAAPDQTPEGTAAPEQRPQGDAPKAAPEEGPGMPPATEPLPPEILPPEAIIHPPAEPWKGKLGPKTGGVRLYFYEREREIAERAAGFITDSYRYLVDVFNYVPTRTFPYILYSTYQEFLQTNLFPLQEGVLGVTSPQDLKLTLPYFGDHRLFDEVGTHEMVHQFTIQKIRTLSEEANLWGDPLEQMPLWFIEGIAEYYAQRGLDPEAELLVRDIVINPDFMQGYAMLDFFEDRPMSVLWTYKVGQVRVAFLEETYGKGTIQKIIESSALLVGSFGDELQLGGFAELLKDVTGDEPRLISAKFEEWIKRRSYRTILASQQGPATVEPLEHWDGRINALNASPSGELVMYRSMDPESGQSRLILTDWRRPQQTVKVAADGVPGIESLHPVAGRNFDLTNESLVFVGESNGRDVIYWQSIRHKAEKLDEREREVDLSRHRGPPPRGVRDQREDVWDVELDLGRRTAYQVRRHDIIAVEAPSFSPDGRRVAFIGLTLEGQKDLWVLEPRGDDFQVTRLTNDVWAERQVSWGPDGVVFTSDATAHGKYNLFRVDPDGDGTVERLTTEDRDHFDPEVLADGRTLFVAYDHARADVYEIESERIVRRTDMTSGVFDVAPGPEGGLWTLWHHGGQRRPAQVKVAELFDTKSRPEKVDTQVRQLPHQPLTGAETYEALAPRNWELGNLFGFFGAGGGGVFGQLLASGSDRLRNHAVVLNLFVLGSFELTDGYLLYINQERRLTWGGGPFQALEFRLDRTFQNLPSLFTSAERFYGVLGSARWPFNTYQYVQADLSVGGVNYFLLPETRLFLASPVRNGTGRDLLQPWVDANSGTRFQTEATVRLGYDTIRYHRATGPLAGSSALLELTTTVQPFDETVFGSARLDAETYVPIYGRTNFFLRGGGGTSFGGRLARQYYLSSFDTLRGVPFGNTEYLLGRNFLFSTAELQFPLNSIVRLILFSDIEAVLGADFGGVGEDPEEMWDKRVLNLVLGVNFGFGPLVFRLHFAKPVDIGAPAGVPAGGDWVTNFSLGWLYF